jgi:ectoine hydroxylase-related dioxygenase (phytanoyl-CoA dioxygenase family)
VESRFYIHPSDLARMIEGVLEPRQALLFGQIQMLAGPVRSAIAFGDHVADLHYERRLQTNRPLPTPTTDWQRAGEDLDVFGYALVRDALSAEEIRKLRARVVDQAAGEAESGVASMGEATQRVWALLNKGRVFHDLLLSPVIEHFVPEMLGQHPVLTGIVSSIALPGNTSSTMHLDQSYITPAVKEIPIGLNILWFLDDVTEKNGGTRVMPGSHKNNIAPADPFDIADTVAAEGPAGTALLLDSRVWHAVGHNHTDRRRHLLVSYFNRSFVRPQENYFLSLRPGLVETFDERVQVMLGYRCTGSLGGVEGPIEGLMVARPERPVGELRPSVSAR